MKQHSSIIKQLNDWGKTNVPFGFIIDFEELSPIIFPIKNTPDGIYWKIPSSENLIKTGITERAFSWNMEPVSFDQYISGFELVMRHIHNGDTYLLNYTQPTKIETNLSAKEIFHRSKALYKIYLENRFVCFSPESFVKIKNGRIYSYPMKGTIEAEDVKAAELILKDTKELAEHNTIVDLIRNDLSLVSEDVKVEKFRYLDLVKTNLKNLWQVSSEISGKLPENYAENIGDIIFKLLPAGSVSGAPKRKTTEIIKAAENYKRGYYTGIFGIFDGRNLDSCVLIRFIDLSSGKMIYKSGGGITFMSDARKEYEEMIRKVYVPFT
jgi:para-aminobenzoate synthetase component 1